MYSYIFLFVSPNMSRKMTFFYMVNKSYIPKKNQNLMFSVKSIS